MIWDCVAAGGSGNIVQVEGRIDSTKYQESLEANVQRSVQTLKLRRGWVFQRDNAPKACPEISRIKVFGMVTTVPSLEYY